MSYLGIELDDSPSYEEILDQFGTEVSLGDAVKKTSTLQDRYPGLVGIGSIVSSPEVYGTKNLRKTSRGLDFVADEKTIREMDENFSEC